MSRVRALQPASVPDAPAAANVQQRASHEPVGPIVKWAGGKRKLLPELLSRLPERFGRYYEPFAGGAALFFALCPAGAVLGDANADLIAMYTAVRDDVDGVIYELRRRAAAHGEAAYYATRDAFNERTLSPFERAAAFLYLNRVCFNGLWRVNAAGEFNVPFGRYVNPRICDVEKLRAASRALHGVDLRAGDYRTCVDDAIAGDLVYFDPPYDGTFNAYTTGAFDQGLLALEVARLVRRGVHVLVSNNDTPLVRALYAMHKVHVVRCPRAINSKGTARGDVDEVIVVGRAPCAHVQLDMFAMGGSPS